jgi:hypothetical protein
MPDLASMMNNPAMFVVTPSFFLVLELTLLLSYLLTPLPPPFLPLFLFLFLPSHSMGMAQQMMQNGGLEQLMNVRSPLPLLFPLFSLRSSPSSGC